MKKFKLNGVRKDSTLEKLMKLLKFGAELRSSREPGRLKQKYYYELVESQSEEDEYNSVSEKTIDLLIHKLETLIAYRSVVESSTNEYETIGNYQINTLGGLCSYLDTISRCRFYIAQQFPGVDDAVFPVDYLFDGARLWESKRRWEYVQHSLTTLKDLKSKFHN